MSVEPSLYLVDGSGYIFRAYYAIRIPLSTASGMRTNAIMGFTRMLRALLEAEHPDYVGVAFDVKGPSFRKEMYPAYKANRRATPEDLVPQLPYFRRVVRALNIPVLEAPGWEADDVIGTLAERAKTEWGLRPVLVTGDKDFMQLVDDRATMIDPMKDKLYGPDEVIEKFGVPPERVIDLLGLAGDSSDNIPGVPGIGAKTAAKLLQEYGTLEDLLAVAETIKGKRGENLREFADQARLSRDLATIRRDVPLEVELEDLLLTPPDTAALRELYTELEFKRFLRELDQETEGGGTGTGGGGGEYTVVTDLSTLATAVGEVGAGDLVAIDIQTTGESAMRSRLVGFALSWAPGRALYVPLLHYYIGVPEQPTAAAALDLLRPLLEDPDRPKTAHDHKEVAKVLDRYGVALKGVVTDPMLSSYLLRADRQSHGLEHLSDDSFGYRLTKYSEVVGDVRNANFTVVPVERAAEYAGERADYARRVAMTLADEIAEGGLSSLMDDIEMPLTPVLLRMELAGMLIDGDYLAELSIEFGERLAALEAEIYEMAGREFLIASTKQLGVVLFDDLGLPVVKKTKTQRSTDHGVLEKLADKHPLPGKVLAWRHLAKLKSTYVDALPLAIHPETGRVHSTFKQAVAATGRLSSDSPNLQNIPVRTEEGRRIREAFVAPPGQVLLSADYSQVELRVLAHLAGDEGLIESFRAGEDIHARTASEIFNVFPAMVSKEQRTAAKAINFGIMYGMSAFRLANDLGIPRRQAKEYIEAYFTRYARVKAYIDETLETARIKGFTTTLFGRRRFLPDLSSSNHGLRSRAEREAMNSPVQGTAADLLKIAMVAVGDAIESGELAARLVLTVHDELLFEVEEASVEPVAAQVVTLMEGVAELAVPLEVDVAWAACWAEAK